MKFLTQKILFISTLFFLIFFYITSTNAQNIRVSQDPKFEQLLNEKRKVNASITSTNRYKIQIFNGSSEETKKTLIQFKKDNKGYDATIVFSTPLYKVWIGSFKTRIEAEKNLNVIRKKYPNAIIIKPTK